MLLIDPSTGEPSAAFTLYAMDCEGEFDEDKDEDEDDEELD